MPDPELPKTELAQCVFALLYSGKGLRRNRAAVFDSR
jgi:hypothetical protein